ncbi:hypothetical protein C0991_004331, partial [Blastosporella zonata]
MFVLEALVLTFVTTPLAVYFYPLDLRRNSSSTTLDVAIDGSCGANNRSQASNVPAKRRFTVVLDRLEHLPGAIEFSMLVSPTIFPQKYQSSSLSSFSLPKGRSNSLSIEALRLIELSDRPSAIMKSSVIDELLRTDPLLAVFKMFGLLHGLQVRPGIDIVAYDDLASSVIRHAQKYRSEMILLPWLLPSINATKSHPIVLASDSATISPSPIAAIKTASSSFLSELSTINHSDFIQDVFRHSRTNVAVFVDHNTDNVAQGIKRQHLFLPFFGSPDDRLALNFVVQCCRNEKVTATVVRMIEKELNGLASPELIPMTAGLPFERNDATSWEGYFRASSSPSPDVSSRIDFREHLMTLPLHASIREADSRKQPGAQLLIVVGRRQFGKESHSKDLEVLMAEYGGVGAEVRKTIGDVATA